MYTYRIVSTKTILFLATVNIVMLDKIIIRVPVIIFLKISFGF